MTIFGWDASDYDWERGPMDLAAARRDGIDFFTHKATESTTTRHVRYGEAMRRARDAGMPILGAYHVVRSPANAAAEVDYMLSYVDQQTPWWRDFPSWFWQVDLEKWPYDSVSDEEAENFADIIAQRTGRRAVIYASKGQYGDALSDWAGLLWNANYGTNPTGHYRQVYANRGGDSGAGWAAYSGRTPTILQFGARTTIGSQNICDANAFRGTLDELRALIGTGVDEMSDQSEEDINFMAGRVDAMNKLHDKVVAPGRPNTGEPSPFSVAIKEIQKNVAAILDALKGGGITVAAKVDLTDAALEAVEDRVREVEAEAAEGAAAAVRSGD